MWRWGGVGGVLTSWRPHPGFCVDNTCRSNLEDALDMTLRWGGVVCINVLMTTSLILRRQRMSKYITWKTLLMWRWGGVGWKNITLKHYLPKKLMKDPHTKSLCPFFAHQVHAWAWRENLGHLTTKILLRQLTKNWWRPHWSNGHFDSRRYVSREPSS